MDYIKYEQRAEKLRTEAQEVLATAENEKRDLEGAEFAKFEKLVAAANELDIVARDLRDGELTELRGRIETATPVAQGEPNVEADFRHYIRTGETRATLVAGTDANGGFIVPEPVHGPTIEKYRKVSPIMANSTVFNMTGDTTMYLPYKNAHGVVANATETGARSQQTEPTFANISLVAYDYYTDQRASQQFLDSTDGAEQWLTDAIYGDIAEQAAADFANGSGTTKAKGVFAHTSTYTTQLSGSAGAIANTNFNSLFFALPQKYRANAKWYLSPATLGVAMGLAMPNLNNTPLVQQKPDGTFTILGKEVIEVDDAPAIGAANYPVAFGDLARGYAIGVHKQATILRDPYTAAPAVRFYAVARLGGVAWDPSAVLLLKSNNA